MAKLPWSEVIANKGLSFGSMRNVFLHLTLVEDRWINYIIPGRSKEWVELNFDALDHIDSIRSYMQRVKDGTEAYLKKLSAEELNRQIAVPCGRWV